MAREIDWDNPFKAEDFDGRYTLLPEQCANVANARFRELVKEHGHMVWGIKGYDEWMSKETADNCSIDCDHTAILICEKIL